MASNFTVEHRLLLDRGDPSAPPGSEPWARSVHFSALLALNDTTRAVDSLERKIVGMREHAGYRQLCDSYGAPFWTWEDYCLAPQPHGLGYSAVALDVLIADRKARSLQERAATTAPLRPQGHPTSRGSVRTSKGSITTFAKGRGADYWLARLARDFPDTLAALQRGDFRSARAAAASVGLVRPTWQVPVQSLDTIADYFRQRLSPADRAALIRLLEAD